MPSSTVIGRSVVSRIVRHGTPSAVVSSWMPPESVSTTRGLRHQAQRLEVALRRQDGDRRRVEQRGEAETLDVAARARMERADERQLRADGAQDLEAFAQRLGAIDVRRAMQRDEAEGAVFAPRLPACGNNCAGSMPARRSVASGGAARGRCACSESIITLPTNRMRSDGMPSRARFAAADRSVV